MLQGWADQECSSAGASGGTAGGEVGLVRAAGLPGEAGLVRAAEGRRAAAGLAWVGARGVAMAALSSLGAARVWPRRERTTRWAIGASVRLWAAWAFWIMARVRKL